MKFKITLLIALTVLVSKMGLGQVNISSTNTFVSTSLDGWNGTMPTGFTQSRIYQSATAATTGGTYAIASSGLGWQASSSVNSLSVVGTFKNTTGSTQTSVTIEYDAFNIVTRASRTPGWTVTSSLGSVTGLNWTYNSSATNASPDVKTVTLTGLSIPNNATFTITWSSNRGTGTGSSPLIGLRNIDVKFVAAATTNYSLTYNGNGNTSGTEPVDPTSPYVSGATVTILGNTGSLAKTGNTFAGWNTAANGSGTSQAVGSTFSMPGANTVLYAQWTTNNYTVSFDANTGSGTMSNQTIAYGATANLVANTFTNTGYTFAGWNTASNGSGTTYADGATLSMGSSNITLFAQWTPIITTPIAQTITFNALANQTIGASDFDPGATASSGLTVTYTSSNPAVATIVGGLIHVVGPGTTIITASQAGNASYLAATDVTQSLTIVSAPLVLAAWDFTGENNVATSMADNYLSSVIYQPNLTRGSDALSSSANNSFRTVGFKNDGISLSNTDYFETSIMSYNSTLSLTSIDAQFAGTASYRATPGVTSQFAYSLDGVNFTLIDVPVETTSLVLPQVDLSTISSLQNLPLGTTITFRYYASGQTTTGGWGFNSSATGVYGLLIQGYAEDSGTALPVEFLDFTATCNEANATDLKWSTASEHNSDYFKVEKSPDGINWSILADVAAAGNATERIDYALVDNEKTRGSYYKLWQYDFDGTATLLATIHESCTGLTGSLDPIIYPNPITDQELTIELRNNKVDFITVQIYSMQGTLVYSQQMKATNQITFSKLNVDPGVYQLILQTDAYEASSFKICIK